MLSTLFGYRSPSTRLEVKEDPMSNPLPHSHHSDDAKADDAPPTDAVSDEVKEDAARSESADGDELPEDPPLVER
jgi:hypothetical protein